LPEQCPVVVHFVELLTLTWHNSAVYQTISKSRSKDSTTIFPVDNVDTIFWEEERSATWTPSVWCRLYGGGGWTTDGDIHCDEKEREDETSFLTFQAEKRFYYYYYI